MNTSAIAGSTPRSPFDGASLPAFRMNQFGGTVGGAIVKDKTFFFASYEGLIQRQGKTQIASVPSPAFRANAVASVQPLINLQLSSVNRYAPNSMKQSRRVLRTDRHLGRRESHEPNT